MQKSIYDPEYKKLIALLRKARQDAGLSQDEVANRLGITASQLSKWERRERRVDLRELRLYCKAIGVPLCPFVQTWEDSLDEVNDATE